jgi:hypothetical protein
VAAKTEESLPQVRKAKFSTKHHCQVIFKSVFSNLFSNENILDYVGGCRCVVLGRNGTIYVGTTKNAIMKMNFEEEYSTIMQVC